MDGVVLQRIAEAEALPAKRLKLSTFDQDQGPSNWHNSTRSWSPNESVNSSATELCLSPAVGTPCHSGTISGFRCLTFLSARPQLQHQLSTAPKFRCAQDVGKSNFYTPPAQVIAVSQQQAPRAPVPDHNLSAMQMWAGSNSSAPRLPEPIFLEGPRSQVPFERQHLSETKLGLKRLRLDSYLIASGLASGKVPNLPQLHHRPPVQLQQQGSFPRSSNLPRSRLHISSTSQCWPMPGNHGPGTGTTWKVQGSTVQSTLPTVDPYHYRPHAAKQPVGDCFRPLPFSNCNAIQFPKFCCSVTEAAAWDCATRLPVNRVCIPKAPLPRFPASTFEVVSQWASILCLERDTVLLTMHMYRRLQCKVNTESGAKGAILYLVGCLWVAAKHEECRLGLPSASKIAALLLSTCHGYVSAQTLNQAELGVLGLLNWQPLKGWDDLYHVKGQPRRGVELLELQQLTGRMAQ